MEQPYRFVDRTGAAPDSVKLTAPFVIPKEALDAEAERLASLPAPENGRRVSMIVKPHAGGNTFTPGTAVSISVLKPGQKTKDIRHNSAPVHFCIPSGGPTLSTRKRLSYHPSA